MAAKVFVDGVEAGTTPLKLQLYEGRHDLRLEARKGVGSKVVPVTVKEGPPQKLKVKLEVKPR